MQKHCSRIDRLSRSVWTGVLEVLGSLADRHHLLRDILPPYAFEWLRSDSYASDTTHSRRRRLGDLTAMTDFVARLFTRLAAFFRSFISVQHFGARYRSFGVAAAKAAVSA